MESNTSSQDVSDSQPVELSRRVPVIAIGASAGGLIILEKFLDSLPVDLGAAVVIIQHLDPTHQSRLPEVLSGHTSLPVAFAEDGKELIGNQVRVITPGSIATYSDGRLLLREAVSLIERSTAINTLLISLAEAKPERSVCILLSGSGSDGSLGVRAMKDAGGITIVQDPKTCEFDALPKNAIATGAVDHVLEPSEMSRVIENYFRLPEFKIMADNYQTSELSIIDEIIARVRAETGHGFSGYKRKMLLRRILRRMLLRGLTSQAEYLDILRVNSSEVRSLAGDFMINVTSFFRDPELFQTLGDDLLTKIIAEKETNDCFRVWVPGCSTGEEAYSIAMLLTEQFELHNKQFRLLIFATDIDKHALDIARNAQYPEAIALDVSPDRLQRFFTPTSSGYEVQRSLLVTVVFAIHNVLVDPPFSRLDLISCRNLLIYLKTEYQSQILRAFHFGLGKGGGLILGNSETIGESTNLFIPVSNKLRIYQRTGPVRIFKDVALPSSVLQRSQETLVPGHLKVSKRNRISEIAEQLLLREVIPGAVLINEHREVLYLYGRVSSYLQLGSGEPARKLEEMVPLALRSKLKPALNVARRERKRMVIDGVIPRDGVNRSVRVVVLPVVIDNDHQSFSLVTFEEIQSEEDVTVSTVAADHSLIQQLENELRSTRDDLQATIDDLEASNEQLRSAHEEVTSMNEELQSTNEELETSTEELQALNQELTTLNTELSTSIEVQETVSNDLRNLLASTDIATVFLDSSFNIKRFTEAARQFMNLIPSDIGRSISDITKKFADADFKEDAEAVLTTLVPRSRELKFSNGSWFVQRTLPYRTETNRIEGIVVTFTDITASKQAEERSQASEMRFRMLADSAPVMIWETNPEFSYVFFNRSWLEFTGRSLNQELNRGWNDGIHPEDRDSLLKIRKSCFEALTPFRIEYRLRRSDGQYRWVLDNGVPRYGSNGVFEGYVGTCVDVSDLKKLEGELRTSRDRYQSLLETTRIVPWEADADMANVRYIGPQVEDAFGFPPDTWKEKGFWASRIPYEDLPLLIAHHLGLLKTEESGEVEYRLYRSDGSVIWIKEVAQAVREDDFVGLRGFFIDITAQVAQTEREKQVEHRVAQSQKLEALGVLAGGVAHDFNNILTAIMGFAEVGVRDSDTSPRLLKCLKGIQKAGLRAQELTSQILAFSRRGEERRVPVDVVEVIDEVLVLMRASVPALIEISRTVIPDKSFYILGDASRLHQVLMNLCTNAYQAIGDNRGVLSVDVSEVIIAHSENGEASLQPGRYVRIIVSDTGCGIPPDVLPRIFEPFFTSRSGGKGTGMGLSVVHGIVSGLEGGIHVSSEVGKGATFEVRLPQCTNLVTAETLPAVEVPMGSGQVLLVDDEELVISGLKELLESVGYSVTAFTNPESALEVFKKDPLLFDILLTDQSMPKMTGIQLIKAIWEIRRELPVILSTGYSREATEETILKLGIQGFIKKPYAFSQLEKMLAYTLEQARQISI